MLSDGTINPNSSLFVQNCFARASSPQNWARASVAASPREERPRAPATKPILDFCEKRGMRCRLFGPHFAHNA